MALTSVESIITVQAGCDGCGHVTTHSIAELSDGALLAVCGSCATATLLQQD